MRSPSDSKEPVVVEQIFNSPLVRVWNALTRPDQMKEWFFEQIEDFKPELGFKTSFNVQSGGRDFPHLWTVSEVVPRQKLTINWKYGGYAGDSFVIFELEELDRQTRLRLTHEVVESFPQHIPEFTRESCAEGWHYFIHKSLKEYLDGSREQ